MSSAPLAADEFAAQARKAPTLKMLRDHRDSILEITRRHGMLSLKVFGSVARNEALAASDIDLLVELEPSRSLLDLIAIEQDLSDYLRIPVQVITPALAFAPSAFKDHVRSHSL